jgi:hypothetical protein
MTAVAAKSILATPMPTPKDTRRLLKVVQAADQDFEWYPTSAAMIAAVSRHIPTDRSACSSIMDIGAGDGRVLKQLAKRCEYAPALYSIEKSNVLIQAQPADIIPVGTDLFEQNLTCLPVDVIFCNPPYSQYVSWATMIVGTGHAKRIFLVIPQRWKGSKEIAQAIRKRNATARVIHSDDFQNADRSARAVIDIVEISYPSQGHGHRRDGNPDIEDPFNIWFAEHVEFNDDHKDEESDYESKQQREKNEMARLRSFENIKNLVDAYDEEYGRMQSNYRTIFTLDYALLKELGVNKDAIRDGIKLKMVGLKSKYWGLLFEHLSTITDRLCTATKKTFLETLTGRTAIAFTTNNAYAVVIWAIKNANAYFDQQTTQLFRDLSTFEGVLNYTSNVRTWERNDWRYFRSDEESARPSRYGVDYRIVVHRYQAIGGESWDSWGYPGGMARPAHEMIADVIAVLYNLGFQTDSPNSLRLQWESGKWHNWMLKGTGEILFQVKGFCNGNLHMRFMPAAIKALNVEAGRLLGWLRSPVDVETELGYTAAEAQRFFCSTNLIAPSSTIRLLEGVAHAPAPFVQTALFAIEAAS